MNSRFGGWVRAVALFLGWCAMGLATCAAEASDQAPPAAPDFFSNMTEGTPADKGAIALPYAKGGPNCGPEQWVDFAKPTRATSRSPPFFRFSRTGRVLCVRESSSRRAAGLPACATMARGETWRVCWRSTVWRPSYSSIE